MGVHPAAGKTGRAAWQGCGSRRGRGRNGSQPGQSGKRRRPKASAGLAATASSSRIRDQVDTNFLDVNRKVEQLPAEEVLESLHRILHQVCAELLNVLKDFERSSEPIYRYAWVRVGVVGGSVDGARGGVPIDPEVLQEIRDPVIEEVVEPRVVGNWLVSDTELFQEILEPLREPQRVVAGESAIGITADTAAGCAAR